MQITLTDCSSILKSPAGGPPRVDSSKYGAAAADKPIYGAKDAGRRLYLTVRQKAIASGMTESKTMKSLYYVCNEAGKCVLFMLRS
eukprot:11959997-Karenia_brevis.AAC.1